jgi:hypothetical protein
MFDDVVCRYPLPHHQDARFQTKDLAGITLGLHWITGTLDEYEIARDGRLRRRVHEREWVEDPSTVLGGYMKSVRNWWEDVSEAHGDVWIYTTVSAANAPNRVSTDDISSPADGDDTTCEGHGQWIEFRVRFTNGRVQDVEDLSRPFTRDTKSSDAAPLVAAIAEADGETPEGSDEARLLASIRGSQASLAALLRRANGHWGREDAVYRYYHQSFKVYSIQSLTLEIVTALKQVMPDRQLCAAFSAVIVAGTGTTFSPDDNRRWTETTRPMLEAFFHALYFLDMMVKYGRMLEAPPRTLPSGWAAVLTLYGLR